jgi:glycerophosphoryl diester phosphodiesterase
MLDVEIKEPDITEDTVRLLLKYYTPEKFIITSFFDEVIKYLKEAHPQIKRGLLFDIESDFDLENRIKRLKPDFLMAHFLAFNSDLRKTCEISGLKCIIWTVNDPDEIKRFLSEDHVAGIISDRPELAVSIYKKVLNR